MIYYKAALVLLLLFYANLGGIVCCLPQNQTISTLWFLAFFKFPTQIASLPAATVDQAVH